MSKPANIEIYNELKRRIIEMEYKPGDALNEKQLIEEFGERGRMSVEENFDIPVTLRNFVKII